MTKKILLAYIEKFQSIKKIIYRDNICAAIKRKRNNSYLTYVLSNRHFTKFASKLYLNLYNNPLGDKHLFIRPSSHLSLRLPASTMAILEARNE